MYFTYFAHKADLEIQEALASLDQHVEEQIFSEADAEWRAQLLGVAWKALEELLDRHYSEHEGYRRLLKEPYGLR